MSLIATVISKYGIVHTADSNLSNRLGAAGTGKKVFSVPYLNAALSVAGSYSVSGQRMDLWMEQLISDYRIDAPSYVVADFAEYLEHRLEGEMTRQEKTSGSIIHIAGYASTNEGSHPEFHFVRNIAGIDQQSGSYTGFADHFATSEDFWTRDYRVPSNASQLRSGGYQLYINGYPDGRIGYLILLNHLGQFLKSVWSENRWSFRQPRTLDETAMLVELQLQIIGTIFQISDYSAPFIGGAVQVEKIFPPPDAIPF
jgi:hypothetical protein